jgi:hypothetical protein
MAVSAYRFTSPIMVVIRDTNGYLLRELPSGSVFWSTSTKPDSNNMIAGTCDGTAVLMFLRDLEERTSQLQAPGVKCRPDPWRSIAT